MTEAVAKRLQDAMRMFSICLEEMDGLMWLVKDILNDLVELESIKCNPVPAPAMANSADPGTQTKQDAVPVS